MVKQGIVTQVGADSKEVWRVWRPEEKVF